MKIKNQLSTFYFSSLNLKKNEIGHGFSLFIFQLAEKMNDPKIHALVRLTWFDCNNLQRCNFIYTQIRNSSVTYHNIMWSKLGK